MNILITGGAGFIGSNIAKEAIKLGHTPILFDSFIRKGVEENARKLDRAGATIIRGDVRNSHDFDRVEATVDAIIHLAANPSIPWSIAWPMYDFTTNTVGTLNVLEYSRHHGKIPVIFASTNKIYSEEINDIPIVEKETRYEWDSRVTSKKSIRPSLIEGWSQNGVNEYFPMDSGGRYPHSPYGVSKASADLYCQEYYHIYGVPTVINRMSCIYGLFQKGVEDQGWLDWFIRAKQKQLPISIYGDGKQVRDALFGTDLAQLYLLELEKIDSVKGNVFNVGGGIENTTSLLEAISYLNTKGSKPLSLTFKDWRQADQKIYISDTAKVKKTLHWKPTTTINEGIDRMSEQIQWEMF